jgi:hypothetical protein
MSRVQQNKNLGQKIENYDCTDCPADPKNEVVKQVGDTYSPCMECTSIYDAKKIRTNYDQYWLQFYNTKAQNTSTDLLDLQFAQ